MNSEYWEQLWREQAVPPSAVNMDRFHEQLHTQPEEWERDIHDHEWLMIRLLLFGTLISSPELFMGDFRWGTWLRLLSNLLLLGWFLVRRWQRRRIYRDYGMPLRARLDQIELGLRARYGSWTNAAMVLGMSVVMILMLLKMLSEVGFGWEVSVAISVGFVGGMVFASRAQARVDKARLETALQRIERARAQLGSDEVGGERGKL